MIVRSDIIAFDLSSKGALGAIGYTKFYDFTASLVVL